VCGFSRWQGKPISLHVDHVDGNPYDHSLSNLRLICPNCHTQTPTYGGRNRGRGRKSRKLPDWSDVR
jgi:5-methylcytosine-specific restriction endonuclease McrA